MSLIVPARIVLKMWGHTGDRKGGEGRPVSYATDGIGLAELHRKIRVCRKIHVSVKQDKV